MSLGSEVFPVSRRAAHEDAEDADSAPRCFQVTFLLPVTFLINISTSLFIYFLLF